jgi:enamine deaminase RidA (YjgF/YER057c/UK114 family)
MERKHVSTDAPWEPILGYCCAMRIGSHIYVSGTTAIESENIIAEGDAYGQTVYILKRIEKALSDLGATLGDIVRTRIYLKDITKWKEVTKAHSDFLGVVKPTCTLVEVSKLITPGLLVEIEADAILSETSKS